jgi:hypothetical protein
LPNGIRSRLKASSEPQYVLCSVDVPVLDVPAQTDVHPVRDLLLELCKRTTSATRLGGVLRVNRYDSYPSFFRFGY